MKPRLRGRPTLVRYCDDFIKGGRLFYDYNYLDIGALDRVVIRLTE